MIEWLFSNARTYTDLFVFLGVVGGGLGWIWRMLATSKKQVEALLQSVQDNGAALKKIQEQLNANGGTSVFDMVKATVAKTEGIADSLARLQSWQWAVAETIAHPMWESDAEGKCLRINNAMAKLTGRSSEQMQGNGWENIVEPVDRERVYREWKYAVERQRAFESEYIVCNPRDVKHYRVRAVALPARSSNGKVVGHIGRFETVTPID